MARHFGGNANILVDQTASGINSYPISIAGWVQDDVTGGSVNAILSIGDSAETNEYVLLGTFWDGLGTRVPAFRTKSDTNAVNYLTYNTSSTLPSAATTWNHIACSFDGESLTIWLNGSVAHTSVTLGTAWPHTLDRIHVGASMNGGTLEAKWLGRLADVAVWSAILSSEEIQGLASWMSPLLIRPSQLAAYVPIWGTTVEPIFGYLDGGASGDGVVTNTTLNEHPPVFYPSNFWQGGFVSTSGLAPTHKLLLGVGK